MSGAATREMRRRYAVAMTRALPAVDTRLRDAFAAVPREDFLGPPPWHLLGAFFRPLQATDPAEIYNDVLVRLDEGRGVNNGSPALHAHMLHLLDPKPGERVLHLGAGTGYYTAILAELIGPGGRVTAVEYDAALAERARACLAPWPQVTVETGDAADWPREDVARIYVNFAVADPADAWLDRLTIGGRLVCPLGVPARGLGRTEHCALLVLTRAPGGLSARFDVPVAFIFAEGRTAGAPAVQRALRAAFVRGGQDKVRSFLRGPADRARCWMTSARYSLSTDPVPGEGAL